MNWESGKYYTLRGDEPATHGLNIFIFMCGVLAESFMKDRRDAIRTIEKRYRRLNFYSGSDISCFSICGDTY